MARWNPAPIVGGAYKDDTRPFSVQDTVNWIPERAERPGGRAESLLRDAPGAHAVCDLGTGAPIRGLHNCEGRLLAVSGGHLYEVASNFAATSRGAIPGVSRVSIAHNQITGGNEVLIANGQSGYVYNTVTETLAQVTDSAYPGAIVVDYLAQVMPQIEPQRRFWFHSDVTQATQYLSTDEYEAESAPDLLVTLIASHGQLLVLGDRTGDFFAATGGTTSFFERIEGTTLEVGCASAHAVNRLDATVFWVGSDGIGYRLNGYNAQRITTHAIEQAWARCDLKKVFCFTFEDRGHKIWYVTFPDGQTWGYDVATQEWHRRTSHGLDRWRMNALVYWNGQWIGGDYSNGMLYRLDWGHKYEGEYPIERERVSGVLHDNQNNVGLNAVELVFAASGAESLVHEGITLSGDLPDGTVGDTGTYHYTSAGGVRPHVFTIDSGSLPPGATMDADGLVTYTYSAGGAYTWTVKVTDAVGTTVSLADSAGIAAGYWWATTSNASHLADVWESADLTGAWSGPVARTPNVATSSYGPVGLGADVALIGGTQDTLERITDFDTTGGYATTTVTLGTGIDRIRAIGAIVVAFNQSSNTYYTSADRGETWTARTAPGAGKLIDVQRLDSGRWIALLNDGPSTRFLYSDDANEPVNWSNATGGCADIGGGIACNGTAACYLGVSNQICRTTDGATWTNLSNVPGANISYGRDACAIGDVMLIAGEGATTTGYIRSTDAGLTWGEVVSTAVIARFDTYGQTVAASFSQVSGGGSQIGLFSDDVFATTSDIPLPYTVSDTDIVRVGLVVHV